MSSYKKQIRSVKKCHGFLLLIDHNNFFIGSLHIHSMGLKPTTSPLPFSYRGRRCHLTTPWLFDHKFFWKYFFYHLHLYFILSREERAVIKRTKAEFRREENSWPKSNWSPLRSRQMKLSSIKQNISWHTRRWSNFVPLPIRMCNYNV